MVKDLHDFLDRLDKDSEFKNELKKALEMYPERDVLCSFSFDDQVRFIYEVIIPFAKKHGFEFNLEDIITENSGNIDEKYLEEIAGGVKFSTRLSVSTLAAIQALTMVAPVRAETGGKNVSLPEEETSYFSKSETKDNEADYGNIVDVLESSCEDLHPISENYPMNEVDGIVFATLSYLPMNVVPNLDSDLEDREITISEWCKKLSEYFDSSDKKLNKLHSEDDHNIDKYSLAYHGEKNLMRSRRIRLMNALSKSPRYKNIKIGDFKGKYVDISHDDYEQFAAVTFTLEDGTKVVTFRGTDSTLSGWKEDLDLSWSKQVPAQKHALEYLERIYELNPNSDFVVTGHSKGGHMAIYSSFYLCNKNSEFSKKLKSILNYDGPGLRKDIVSDIDSEMFDEISEKLTTFIPQSSVIGRIMNDTSKGRFICVYSASKNLFNQHDSLNWSIHKEYETAENKFRSYEIQPESEFSAAAISIFLDAIDKGNAMQIFVNWFFDFMYRNDISIGDERSKSQIFKDVFYNYFIRGKSFEQIINLIFHPKKAIYTSEEEEKSFREVMKATLKAVTTAYWRKHLEMNKRIGIPDDISNSVEKMIKDEYSVISVANVVKTVGERALSINNIWKFIKKLYS